MQRTKIPTYEQIAIDLANRIYKVGEKTHKRSTLFSEYKVSQETIHRTKRLKV